MLGLALCLTTRHRPFRIHIVPGLRAYMRSAHVRRAVLCVVARWITKNSSQSDAEKPGRARKRTVERWRWRIGETEGSKERGRGIEGDGVVRLGGKRAIKWLMVHKHTNTHVYHSIHDCSLMLFRSDSPISIGTLRSIDHTFEFRSSKQPHLAHFAWHNGLIQFANVCIKSLDLNQSQWVVSVYRCSIIEHVL